MTERATRWYTIISGLLQQLSQPDMMQAHSTGRYLSGLPVEQPNEIQHSCNTSQAPKSTCNNSPTSAMSLVKKVGQTVAIF